jgi:hypothetical protein
VSAAPELSDPAQPTPSKPPRIALRRFLVWLLLASILSSFFVSVRFPPLVYLTLIGTFALLFLWEGLKKALRRRFAISVDTTYYALAAAATIYVAHEIDVALIVPEGDLLRFLFGWPKILAEALGQAIAIAFGLFVCSVVAALGAVWTIAAYIVRKVIAWRRKRREAPTLTT